MSIPEKLATRRLPDTPGVYFFLGTQKEILYIGKATSLRDRVRSYFTSDLEKTRGAAIAKMLGEIKEIVFRETDSVLEALILEASLIKTHKPSYNTLSKDDKSYNYLVITNEAYPRVLSVRGHDLDKTFSPRELKYVFGPFPQGLLFKEALKLVRKIFPFRDKCTPESGKPCFNAQIGLCPGVCSGATSQAEYRRMINHIRLFFEGKKRALLKELEREMHRYAKREEFEKAGRIKRQLFALQHINDVTLIKREVKELPRGVGILRIEAYDVAHLSGKHMVGVMVVVENGSAKKTDYRKFKVREVEKANDTAALKEVLRRRFAHDEWRLPSIIVVDGGKAQIRAAKEVLDEFGYKIPVVSIVKDTRHRAREVLGNKKLAREHEADIALANSEAHRFAIGYHRSTKRRALVDK